MWLSASKTGKSRWRDGIVDTSAPEGDIAVRYHTRVDLELSEDQRFFRDTTRKFLAAEAPVSWVRTLEDDPAGFPAEWWRRGAALGWTSLLVPEAAGGGGVGAPRAGCPAGRRGGGARARPPSPRGGGASVPTGWATWCCWPRRWAAASRPARWCRS